uniref:MULE transposase domain-containing protein n=1 Tax=Amphimedon queenslandica TaxID=400682 RepID=A0A1X7V804_AMPQE
MQLVQSNEVNGSYHMEKEGLRSINKMIDYGLNVAALVTDRHRQIGKWIRENLPNVKHYYDVWHFAK